MKKTEIKKGSDVEFDITLEEIFPLAGYCLVDPLGFQGEKTTKSGIVLSESHSSATPTLGKVVRVGPTCPLKVGSAIFFRRYSLDEIEVPVSDGKRKFNFINTTGEDTGDVMAEYRPIKK